MDSGMTVKKLGHAETNVMVGVLRAYGLAHVGIQMTVTDGDGTLHIEDFRNPSHVHTSLTPRGETIIQPSQIWQDLAEAIKKDMHPDGFKRVK
ncbi:hypothetical protein QJS10_CPB21g01075 [Acorus calamus]|uniref:Uncharacterized protein n=1 Tax=Acorus calamus TaxID=4465 RepID=A0AAV9C8G2_ACOCL|nr:hypothetical protein QJS10_CPB21g01075 [Acorus calamus]